MGALGGVMSAATTQAAMSLLDQLMMNLKAINIESLQAAEKEQLRFLSTQYQFHLTQFQQFQKSQILLGHYFEKGKDAANKEARRQSGKEIATKDEVAGNVYSSQERFVLNEKNLSEFRLKKSRDKAQASADPTGKKDDYLSNSAAHAHEKKDDVANSKSGS